MRKFNVKSNEDLTKKDELKVEHRNRSNENKNEMKINFKNELQELLNSYSSARVSPERR